VSRASVWMASTAAIFATPMVTRSAFATLAKIDA
jgi:hypothetical protein